MAVINHLDIVVKPRNTPRRVVRLKVGTKLRQPCGGALGTLWHVRGFVDGQVVLRTWSRPKQRWRYEVEPLYIYAATEADNGPACGLYVPKCPLCGGDGCSTCRPPR